jgi:4-hydroxybenzoyl-CoA reductase subunit alpha
LSTQRPHTPAAGAEFGPADTHAGQSADGGVVGRGGQGKIDGLDRIIGAATFVDDLTLPRMVHAKLLRSPHAHARIVRIDAAAAEAMPGVLAVVVGTEIPMRHGAIPVANDETALAVDKVRYIGEPVACVAAATEQQAFEACRAIVVEYEALDTVLTIDDAMSPDKPILHDHARKPSNVLRRVFQTYGDVDAGFAEADMVLEEVYEYPGSTHVPLEPHAALAAPDPDGRLTIWSSTQNPHYVHKTLARVLGMRTADIRLIKPAVGAGYGGKCDTFVSDICAAFLARKLQRPVKMAFDREEVFYAHRGRHRTRMWLKMGMKKDGTITAIDFKAWADGGAYASYGVVTAYYLGVFLTLPYRVDNVRFTSLRVYTNHPPCGPKRGHGAIQPRFAVELHLDRMALALGLDPAQVRRQSVVAPDTETVNGLRVTSVGLEACIDAVLAASGYHDKRGKLPPGRGIGLACSAYMCGALHGVYPDALPHSGVQLQLDRSGRVMIFAGTADVGQGSSHMLATLVAERFGISLDHCRVIEGDTELTPVDLGSYSSRVTFMAGNAALDAADRLRAQIFDAVAEHLGCAPTDLTAHDNAVHHGDQAVPWVEAVILAETKHGTLGSEGSYRPPKIGSRFRRQSVGPSPAYSFTAQVAEVTIDEETGILTIDKMWCAHDLGRVLHPEIAEGQVEGCVYMGVGEALLEEQAYRDGLMTTPSILEYRIPTVYDTPEIASILIESHDPGGPFGAKEVGEGPQLATVPAIGNAIFDAIGHWLTAPPYTPDKVWRALRGKPPQAQRPLPPDRVPRRPKGST